MMTVWSFRNRILQAGLGAAALSLAGCQSGDGPAGHYITSPTDINPPSVELTTDVLEVALPATRNGLTSTDKAAIEHFVSRYEDVGRGALIVTSPVGGSNAQQAVRSVADIRALAYGRGVEYDQMSVRTYEAEGLSAAPIVLSFQRYEAVAPDCPLLSQVDMSDISNNSELSVLGCAVNTNLAAMIADPADLRGDRDIDPTNTARSDEKFNRYQAGEDIQSQGEVSAELSE